MCEVIVLLVMRVLPAELLASDCSEQVHLMKRVCLSELEIKLGTPFSNTTESPLTLTGSVDSPMLT